MDSGKATHKCRVCNRTFVRTEHLVRHERTHNRERPFQCQVCGATFARLDVCQNHLRKVHPESYLSVQELLGNNHSPQATSKRKRVREACQSCRQRKLRCSGVAPCDHCSGTDRPCVFKTNGTQSSSNSKEEFRTTTATAAAVYNSSSELDMTANETRSMIMDRTGYMHTVPTSDNSWLSSNPASMVESLGTIGDLEPALHSMMYERDQNGSRLSPNLQARDDVDNNSRNTLGLLEGEPNLADTMDFSEFWPLQYAESLSWTDDFNLIDNFQTPPNISLDALAFESTANANEGSHYSPALNARNALTCIRSYFEQKGLSESRSERPKLAFPTPSVQMYDAELVDLLAALAVHHLAKTFPFLSVQIGSDDSRSRFCTLAMAAVGGSFCHLPGRLRVVNAMYNDARRIFLPRAQGGGFRNLTSKLIAIKTFMLLEIYGYCSGDKRSFEFVEVFHSRMLFFVEDFKSTLRKQAIHLPLPLKEASQALSLSLYVLECYRVVLLMRPPNAFFRSLFQPWQDHENVDPETSPVDNLVDILFTPGAPIETNHSYKDSASALLNIAILASPRLASSDPSSIVRSVWSSEYFELALSKWANFQSRNSADRSLMTLYHLICINLHVNLILVQHLVHSSGTSSGMQDDARVNKMWLSLESWHKSRHYPAAKWHAEALLSRVNEAQQLSNENIVSMDSNSDNIQHAILPESPHLPYAVYSATCVLWCGNCLSEGFAHPASVAYLDNSILLLAGMKVRIAALLQRPLRRLRSRLLT